MYETLEIPRFVGQTISEAGEVGGGGGSGGMRGRLILKKCILCISWKCI